MPHIHRKYATIVNIMFTDWLLDQLRSREWTQADLARVTGLTRAAISKYINGRIPNDEALEKIAHAFKIPKATIYSIAGLLPSISEEKELINQILHLTSQLPEQDQQDILEYARMRVQLAEKRGSNENKRKARKVATSP